MNSIDYIRATKTDISTLVDLRIEFLSEYLGKQPEEAEKELRNNLQDYFNRSINDDSYICWLAIINGKAAGVGGLAIREQPGSFKNPSGRVGYILNMYTVPDHRRKGICSSILNKLTDTAGKRGIIAFELHATEEGEPVYIKNGFLLHPEPTYRKYIFK